MQDQPLSESHVLFKEEGRAAFITLDRPEASNALSLQMIRDLEACYHRWARKPRIYGVIMESSSPKAFCVGADLRAVYDPGRERAAEAAAYYREAHQHCWTLQCFIKPQLALIDGVIMGGGVGACLYGTQRIAGENFRLAMPECGVGLFPDMGGGYFLSRLPGETGMYLALTGASIGPADAWRLGLVTHCMPSSSFARVKAAVVEGDTIDPMLAGLHEHPGEGEIQRLRPAIDRIFSAESVEAILARLDAETGGAADWAQETAAAIRRNAPLSVKVAYRMIREGARQPDLKAELRTEYRLASRFLRGHDFHEGVRALMVDKDHAPRWRPATLEEATDNLVNSYFAPLPDGELELVDHWKLVD
jgi:enoyl-CoA hydratase